LAASNVTRRFDRIGPRDNLRYISALGTTGSGTAFAAPDKTLRARVFKIICPAAGCGILVLAALTLANAAVAADDFPFTGKYTQNTACKGDGTDAETAKVTISPQEIVSNIGTCTILDTKHNDNSFFAHVECKFPSGPLMGDVTFTPRPDKTIEFVDRDGTYKAVLYPCPK
jgi:hypothetical protein